MDNVTLPPELVRFATEAVAAGRYRDMSDVLTAGVRLLQRQEQARAEFIGVSARNRRQRDSGPRESMAYCNEHPASSPALSGNERWGRTGRTGWNIPGRFATRVTRPNLPPGTQGNRACYGRGLGLLRYVGSRRQGQAACFSWRHVTASLEEAEAASERDGWHSLDEVMAEADRIIAAKRHGQTGAIVQPIWP